MARSYRTDKPRVIAGRRLARNDDGEIVLPPILVRRPRKGDVHPLSSAHELGHHYRNQYRIRRGSERHRHHEELVAELHSERFYDALRRKLRRRNVASGGLKPALR
jgi:hypothetical protein